MSSYTARRGYHCAISYRLPSRTMRSAPCSGTLKAYVSSKPVEPPGGMGRTRSRYIMVSSTRVRRVAEGQGVEAAASLSDATFLPFFLLDLLTRCLGAWTHCFASAMSKPPLNPAPPNRLSDANSSEPVLPGRNRFWSNCIQTYRRVSGELL